LQDIHQIHKRGKFNMTHFWLLYATPNFYDKNEDFEKIKKKNVLRYSSNLQVCQISTWVRYFWNNDECTLRSLHSLRWQLPYESISKVVKYNRKLLRERIQSNCLIYIKTRNIVRKSVKKSWKSSTKSGKNRNIVSIETAFAHVIAKIEATRVGLNEIQVVYLLYIICCKSIRSSQKTKQLQDDMNSEKWKVHFVLTWNIL